MEKTRREFMKAFGISLASLLLAQCKGRGKDSDLPVTCYTVVPDAGTPDPDTAGQLDQQEKLLTATAESGDVDQGIVQQARIALARGRLRSCWLGFEALARRAAKDADGSEKEQLALADKHRAALDSLVSLDELSADVADYVQVAFDAAAFHVWRANAPITCYKPMEIDYRPASSQQLTEQAEILIGMSADTALDPQVVAQAQAAIEQDIALLSLSDEQLTSLFESAKAAKGGEYPSFKELALDISPEMVQAAQFLIALLLPGAELD
jgi:hypothetical protein